MTTVPQERAPIASRRTAGTETGRRHSALRRSHVQRVVLVSDAAGATLAAAISAGLASWPQARSAPGNRLALLGIVVAVVVGVLVARGGRRVRIAPRVADDLGFLTSSLIVAGLMLLALRSIHALGPVVRPSSIVIAVGAAALLVPLAREVGTHLAARSPANVERVIVVGSGFIAAYLTERLSRSPLVHVLGLVDDRPGGAQRVLGIFEDLPRLCRTLCVDRVVIAFSQRHPARSAEVLHAARAIAEVDVVVRFFEIAGWESRLTDVTGLPLLNLGSPPAAAQRAVKRAIDIAVSCVSLTLLSPLLLAAALWVRVQSGPPVLFRQERVGRDRRPFEILKFRTMRPCDAPPDGPRPSMPRTPYDTVPDRARITRVGSVLRRTGIDELPQLINVLRGQMSLVGPRPFVPEECGALSEQAIRRFQVRPGMTGMWQVCGQHELNFEELVRLDVQYATNWSLRSDFRILARTPARLLRGSGPDR